MATSKKANSYIFWILQFLGWGMLISINIGAQLILGADGGIKHVYFLFEGVVFVILGVGLTSWIRLYLKRINFVENQTGKNYVKVFGIYVLVTFLFVVILISCSNLIFASIHGKPLGVSAKIVFVTSVNVSIYVFFWVLAYVAIKSIVRMRRNKIDRLQLEASLKESQLNTLKGQLNPHFMFNSLNNIRGLMLEDVDKSREMLTRLSEMLRYSLNMNKVDAIQISQELETVENYIALSKIQLEDRLHYEHDIDASLLQVKIPPMILQMLVENAIKHGIATQKNGGKIKLIITHNTKEIILQVNNTGTLKTESDSTQIGVDNISKRLELLYGEKANFTLKEVNNEVQAVIKIPVS
ncbi:sensor histidine kinase YpdA [Kordia sp. SMS9]|uniref:sensor histidine kinase n=1 Tax=Kordia sp. SMS9 TaxID=2282170 RepID=UPI000E0CFEB4|nr:histidine kinase [Kordia sp. SMS9]AXG68381.1 sensor histidine kinase YpdA [Kordia sp. SMS9]